MPEHLPLWTGLAAALGYYGYAWLAAWVDGRMFWPVHLFAIPLAVYLAAAAAPGEPQPAPPAVAAGGRLGL